MMQKPIQKRATLNIQKRENAKTQIFHVPFLGIRLRDKKSEIRTNSASIGHFIYKNFS